MDKFDFLSPKTTFYSNSKSTYSSWFGGLLTFCTALVSIGLFFFFGSDLFYREEPEVSTSIALNDSQRLDQSQLFPAVALMYLGGFEIKEIHRKLSFNLFTAQTDASKEEITFIDSHPLISCDESAVLKERRTKDAFIADSKMYFCPPDDLKYSIEGPFGSAKFSVFSFRISYCTGRPDCYSPEFIRKNLTDVYFHTVFDDYYIDSFDFSNPVKESTSKILNSVSSGFTQNFHVNLRELNFQNQEGWVFSQNSLRKEHFFNSYDFSLADLNDEKVIINTIFAFDSFKQIYNRSYIKVQDVIAQVGGAVKITNIVFRLLVLVYSHFRVYGERMALLGSSSQDSEFNNSTQNNFIGAGSNSDVRLSKNTVKQSYSCCNLLFRRAKIDEFSKFYRKILSEQNIFELCVLHEIEKKNLVRKAEIETKTKKFVQTRGLRLQGNSGS